MVLLSTALTLPSCHPKFHMYYVLLLCHEMVQSCAGNHCFGKYGCHRAPSASSCQLVLLQPTCTCSPSAETMLLMHFFVFHVPLLWHQYGKPFIGTIYLYHVNTQLIYTSTTPPPSTPLFRPLSNIEKTTDLILFFSEMPDPYCMKSMTSDPCNNRINGLANTTN